LYFQEFISIKKKPLIAWYQRYYNDTSNNQPSRVLTKGLD
jgi:hypothetical protein